MSKTGYKIILTILGETWESSGETLLEALNSIEITWNEIKGKGTLNITCGSKSHEHLFNMARLRKIFSNKIVREHWAKNLTYLLEVDNKTNVPQYAESG